MQLGGESLFDAFSDKHWQAYRGEETLPMDSLRDLIGPNSIDVTLHPKILYPSKSVEHEVVDPRIAESLSWQEHEGELTLMPGECVLGAVNERFDCTTGLHLYMGDHNELTYWKQDIDGRSTVGRMFLQVHMTAGFGDYGFSGAFTLEITNVFNRPIRLYPGMRIAQVFFTRVYRPKRYHGAYSLSNHNDGPIAPSLGKGRF